MSGLRMKTGGSTTLGAFGAGLFIHADALYLVPQEMGVSMLGSGPVDVLRCADGKTVTLNARASVYPVEYCGDLDI